MTELATTQTLEFLTTAVLRWFETSARDLPWRRERDPYRIWLSEVMLQQTQVATVIPYYKRFLAAYPQLEDLAAADEVQVLELWAGLGYYRRARQLLQAARSVRDTFGGRFPDTYEEITRLPGIGRYSAGAVLSIAYGKPYPVLDGNVRRVLSRYLGKSCGDGDLWRLLEELVCRPEVAARVGAFNQGVMELGATICTPRRPDCGSCPLSSRCEGLATGVHLSLPEKRVKSRRVVEEFTVLVVRDGDRFLMRLRTEGPYLEGFWEFPTLPGKVDPEDIPRLAGQEIGLGVEVIGPAPMVRHRITFRDMRFHPFRCRLARPPQDSKHQWITPGTTGRPIAAANRKILHAARC